MSSKSKSAAGVDQDGPPWLHNTLNYQVISPSERYESHLRHGDLELFDEGIVGLDYLVNRRVVVGVDVRPYILPLAFDAETLAPVYLSASVRLSIVFERY